MASLLYKIQSVIVMQYYVMDMYMPNIPLINMIYINLVINLKKIQLHVTHQLFILMPKLMHILHKFLIIHNS